MPPRINPIVAALPATTPFVGPEAIQRQTGRMFKARIGANESVFGPSPKAIAAMAEAASGSWMYGDPENHDLKAALARHHGVKPANIVVGAGIDTLFGLTVRAFTEPGAPVITSLGGYPTFIYHVNGYGCRLVSVPFDGDRENIAGLLDAARREAARVVYFANPDNPMGSWWPEADVQRMIDGTPDGCLLVLDEAYSDTAPAGTIPALDVTNPNVLRFRTFSKAYGLAGMRVGYVIGAAETVVCLDKIRDHFGVSRTALIGADAALADQAYLADAVARIARSRARIAEIAAANELSALPSATNFVTVDCGHDGAFARSVRDGLIARGLFVRMPWVPPHDRCIRISAGTDADLALLAEELPHVLKDLRG